ncbi:MAG: uracil-DNA glycosylase family protein [Myxococcota bacterium]
MSPLVALSRRLSKACGELSFAPPVAHVYDPLAYAHRPHERYLERWGGAPKEVLFLGMNPGPWGMCQTGVPFGEVALARDWLGVEAPVDKPPSEHPKRPIQGFSCTRSEVSGRRLWGWAKERFERPEAFFERFFVANYCPLVFLEEGGRNRVPEKLPKHEREPLLDVCDTALRELVAVLEPALLVGVGAWARKRAEAALGDEIAAGLRIGQILHPSPASPIANRGWAPQAEAQLEALGVNLP